jgi:hypothetical protein
MRKYELMRLNTNNKNRIKNLDEINKLGEKSLDYYSQLFTFIESELKKDTETADDYSSLITLKLNAARICSKMNYVDNSKNVKSLKNALMYYEECNRIFNSTNLLKNNILMEEQYKLCQEMIHMLPVKISKVNYTGSMQYD